MKRRLASRRGTAAAVALTAAVALSQGTRAATPPTGTLSGSATVQWSGSAGVSTAPAEGETTCVDGTSCDVFTLKVAPGSYLGKRVRFRVTWGNSANDIDVYVHRQTLAGPETRRSARLGVRSANGHIGVPDQKSPPHMAASATSGTSRRRFADLTPTRASR